jgi:hypothetical protein
VKKSTEEQKQLTQRRQDAKDRQANQGIILRASLRLGVFA